MAKSLLKSLSNTKTRTLVLLAGGVLTTGIIVAIANIGSSDTSQNRESKTTSIPSGIKSTPGEKTSERYRELQQEANLRGAKDAEKTGDTFVPTIIGGDGGKNKLDFQSELLQALSEEDEYDSEGKRRLSESELERQRRLRGGQQDSALAAILAQRERDDEAEAAIRRRRQSEEQEAERQALREQRMASIEQVAQAMEQQSLNSLQAWSTPPTQKYVSGSWDSQKEKSSNSAGGSINGNANGNGNGSNDKESSPVILKAGSIMFAVLETSINSDEPGPILAKIVQGPLKGSKLIGSINIPDGAEKIALSFSSINIPTELTSSKISAVAIDPDNARTSLASDVDNHYFIRWGSLFAAAFLEGYSKAIGESGTTVETTSAPGTSTTATNKQSLSGRQQLFEGLGKVGETWGQKVGENFSRKPTITIDAGIGIGILITSDFKLGEDPIPPEQQTNTASTKQDSNDGAQTSAISMITNAIQANKELLSQNNQQPNTTTQEN